MPSVSKLMTETEQRITIAEWCGWTDIIPTASYWGTCPSTKFNKRLPDYTKDLNAMWDAEHKLSPMQELEYVENLRKLIGPHGTMRCFDYAHASAAQRAEALLKTIGKWRE